MNALDPDECGARADDDSHPLRRKVYPIDGLQIIDKHSSDQSTISLECDGDWYVAKDEETGVMSQGRSRSEALANLSEALELYDESPPEDVEPGVPDTPWFESSG